jgi:EPS-associated MarR family transcriptional regulator
MHQAMLTDEYRYKILKILEANPEISQRDLARELGISLGRVNFCLKALIEKGLLKASNFRNSQNKLAYMYLLTPRGIEEKTHITSQFLKIKMQEYQQLAAEIEALRRESSVVIKAQADLFKQSDQKDELSV